VAVIRGERTADVAAIREIHRRAFGQEQEGAIVDALRANGAAQLSLVAADGDRVVGHVIYSPAHIGDVVGAALGPMAVLPECQRQGIGSQLVKAGTGQLREAGCPFIVVVGHPAFYPRFGFTPARRFGLSCEWPVPDEIFMALILDEARMRGVTGVAAYRPEFSIVA
jgi:putative acetyltransferase